MNLADVITAHARARPEAPAVVEEGRTLGYRAFDAAIWRVAARLREKGIAAGDVVGISLGSHALHLAAAYALARIGAVQLSLSPEEPEALRRALAQRFRVKTAIAEGDLDPGLLDSGEAPPPGAQAPGGEVGWKIVLTSGTTGAPKAVLQTHAMHIAWCGINQRSIPALPEDRYLAAIPLYFSAGLKTALYVHWGGGAVLPDASARSPEAWHAAVERFGATYLSLTPAHLHTLVEHPPAQPWRRVRLVRSGSMAAGEELCEAVARKLCANLVLSYGSNDAGFPIAFGKAPDLFPAPGVEIGIADGLVRVRAPGLPAGYIDDPEASARAFRDGWYYPGDLGELRPNGALRLLGRADDQINFDGIKIYPAEIEAALLSHPMVAEAAAFALPAEAHQHAPAAAVVLRGAFPHAELKKYLAGKLGQRAPGIIASLKSLPRNAAGKVDRRELARLVGRRVRQ